MLPRHDRMKHIDRTTNRYHTIRLDLVPNKVSRVPADIVTFEAEFRPF